MQFTVVLVIAIVSVVAASTVAERIGVAAPIGLTALGIGLSFVPGVDVHVDPELVLTVVLPPLLYASATRMPGHDFRRNFRTIFSLAVYLVALTTLACGYVVNALVPGVSLAAAFALGAVVSPTDAVAATSVGSKLGLPSRLTTIIEGEGLVNDATALVLLASAITAITQQTHIWRIGVDFVWKSVAAVAIGIVIGWLGVRVRQVLSDAVSTTAISFVIPFVAYLPAEEAHASGVLSTVAAGLVAGILSPERLSAQSRLSESINWRTIAFLLEGGIFLAMGLQLKSLWQADSTSGFGPVSAVWVGLLVALIALAVRVVFVAPIVARLRGDAARAAEAAPKFESRVQQMKDDPRAASLTPKRAEQFQHRVAQRRADLQFSASQRFGWRGGGVLAWSGMRGAITVAAAETLPESTPGRPQLVLIAFTVALATLVVQGVSLPWVIGWLNIPGDDAEEDRTAYADLIGDMASAAAEVLDGDALRDSSGTEFPAEVVDRVREALRARQNRGGLAETDEVERTQYMELMTTVLDAQRTAMLQARSEGRYSSRVLGRAQRGLDVQEAVMQQVRV